MSRFQGNNILSRHPLAVTFAFIALCLLPMMLMRDFTPDNELRYLQIADEAIENGNVFAFTLDGEAYADKPPLYLWLVILGRLLLGKHSMLFLSLFSLIPAFVTICVIDRWGRPGNAVDRLSVAFMMMTCALFLGESLLVRMDMLMTMFIVLALYSFWQLYEGGPSTGSGTASTGSGTASTGSGTGMKRQEILLPVLIFLALFTKGPVGILMPMVAIICFLLVRGKGREIGKYLGWKTWGIMAALCLVWFTGVYLDGGKEYLNNLLFHQTLGRAVNSFHHKAPFWYYLVAVWYMVAPYMFLLVGSIVASLAGFRKEERGDREVFFLVTILSTFVMLSAFSAKLAIYLSPVMPFMVLLFVEVLRRTGWKEWMTWSLAMPAGLMLLTALAVLWILFFCPSDSRLGAILGPYSFIRSGMVKFGVFLLIQGLGFALYLLYRKRPGPAIISLGAFMLLSGYCASSVLPRVNDWIGWGNLCKTIPQEGRVATLYIRRPGPMKVYLGREVVDYQKDFNKFTESEMLPSEAYDGPLTLVTRSSKMMKDEALKSFAEGNRHWFVGPYCLVSVEPEPIGNDNINQQ